MSLKLTDRHESEANVALVGIDLPCRLTDSPDVPEANEGGLLEWNIYKAVLEERIELAERVEITSFGILVIYGTLCLIFRDLPGKELLILDALIWLGSTVFCEELIKERERRISHTVLSSRGKVNSLTSGT